MRVLAFSGGKDSMACLHLCKRSIDCAIYVDTGKSYPETQMMVKYAETIVPFVIVHSDQEEQNRVNGLPSDVVPIDYTALGQVISGAKPVMIQSYLDCHFQNISYPLFTKAKELGATHILYGQRSSDSHQAPARNGDIIDEIVRLHPVEGWSDQDVLDYLQTVMDVPEHYYLGHSSMDCYDCTAFRNETQDRMEYTKERYPNFHRKYQERMDMIRQALEMSGYLEKRHGT